MISVMEALGIELQRGHEIYQRHVKDVVDLLVMDGYTVSDFLTSVCEDQTLTTTERLFVISELVNRLNAFEESRRRVG